MAHALGVVASVVASTYVFLRILLRLTQDAREPPAILKGLPFVSPVIGMLREKAGFHVRLRNQYGLPIYTLRIPFQRIYVVNSTHLIPILQKSWRTVSFAAIAADAGKAVGMSDDALKIMHANLQSEQGFSNNWPKYILPSLNPGKDLDEINRKSIEILAEEMKSLKAEGTEQLGLSEWSKQLMLTATGEAIWGPQNPYRDPKVAEAWKTFETGFVAFSLFPMASTFFPKILRAREVVVAAMTEYMRKGGHESASGLVKMRFHHHKELYGLTLEDIARGELGNTFAVFGNTTPCALWMIYHVYSDPQVLSDIRQELLALVSKEKDDSGHVSHVIDLAAIRTSCPVLLSTFQETLRFRAVNPGPRVILEDVNLDGQYLLKKGSVLMMPATVQHTSVASWGDDVGEFDYKRFTRQKTPRIAFRAFGGGHVLCPGRHFASTEIMAFMALMALHFDIVPVQGKWEEPICDNTPPNSGFGIPDRDIQIRLHAVNTDKKWRFKYSGSDKGMGIVAEDSAQSGSTKAE